MTSASPLTFITGNPGKVAELRHALQDLGVDVQQANHGYPEIQADTLEEVARAGAQHLLQQGVDVPFVLEDAGLFVTALAGFPGVYSAYANQTVGCQGILDMLRDTEAEMRTAAFQACLTYVDEDQAIHCFTGVCKGVISERMLGEGGFGFDPIFVPDSAGEDARGQTFAQMSPAAKDAVSHRGRAAAKLAAFLAGRTAKA